MSSTASFTSTKGFHTFSASPNYSVRLCYTLLSPTDSSLSSATPIVFNCGRSRVKEDWLDLPQLCASSRPVLIFDPRGLGESSYSNPSDQFEFEFWVSDLASDAVQLAKHVFPKAEKFHWFGISMGGFVCQEIGIHYPALVKSLLLGCTSGGGVQLRAPPGTALYGEALFRYWAIRTLTKPWVEANKDKFERIFRMEMTRKRPEMTMLAQIQASEAFKIDHQKLSAFTFQCLIMHGDMDDAIPFEHGEKLHSLIPNSEFVRLPACGHNFWIQEGELAANSMKQFCTKTENVEKSSHY
jgi:pimeloyl-ACP methyl ester carboxylesterase